LNARQPSFSAPVLGGSCQPHREWPGHLPHLSRLLNPEPHRQSNQIRPNPTKKISEPLFNPHLLRKPLISRFSEIFFTAGRAKVPAKPESVARCSVNPHSALRIPNFFCKSLISRFQKISSVVARISQSARFKQLPQCHQNPNNVPTRVNRKSEILNGTTRNIPPCFTICSTSQLPLLQGRSTLFRHIPPSFSFQDHASTRPDRPLQTENLKLET